MQASTPCNGVYSLINLAQISAHFLIGLLQELIVGVRVIGVLEYLADDHAVTSDSEGWLLEFIGSLLLLL